MGGSDTFRGCSFQAAYSVTLALDVLEGAGAALRLEGDADVVDAALESDAGDAILIAQVKTKVEPYVWGPQEIADVIASWIATGPDDATRFEFVTDGSFGPAVTTKLAPALRRLAEGASSAEDRRYLEELNLAPDTTALTRISLRSRIPDGRSLLERSTMRILELRERVSSVTIDEARDLVWQLFGETMIGSGEAVPSKRRVTREQISEYLGVPTAVIDCAEPWTDTLEAHYRESLLSTPAPPEWVVLALVGLKPVPALALITDRAESDAAPQPADALLDLSEDALLVGAAGSGKTTTLAQLRNAALARQQLPIPVLVSSYVPHMLERLLRRSLEQAVGRPLAPGVVPRLLRRQDVIVTIDGPGELPGSQREAFLADLATLRLEHPGARLLIAARDPSTLNSMQPRAFELQPLDGSQRRMIAAEIAPERDGLVAEVEDRLGSLVDNPLIFTMALGLSLRGVRPRTRSALFQKFTAGLEARVEGRTLTATTRSAVETCCFKLRAEGLYNADTWWWLEQLAEARSEAVARGIASDNTPSAEETLADLRASGLVRPVGETAELGLLHDLFCDWLASESVRHGRMMLPDPVDEPTEEIVVFLAEGDALVGSQLEAVAGNAIAAARVADVLPARAVDLDLVQRLWERLARQLATSIRERMRGLRVRAGSDTPLVVWLEAPTVHPDHSGPQRSPVSCVAVQPVSELSLAIDLWLAVVRLELIRTPREHPLRVGESREELALQICEAVEARSARLDELTERVVPDLIDRVRSAAGPLGLRGWLLPASEYPGIPGTNSRLTQHRFNYSRVAEGARVDIVPADCSYSDKSVPTVSTFAESFLRETPRAEARNMLLAALVDLIPRFND